MSRFNMCVAVLVGVLLVAGCGSDDPRDVSTGSGMPENHVKLSDGRTVTCITSLGTNGSVGISCDWANAR